ncbi:transglycosylase domain-containing protein [Aliifodinibius sp. S!AR15-10]|uniref:transglycosylase domain-containing protein n=1 Tax=Aliifodinibius sp. S!AR15-10 TaxID=2950437 RepID=UPI002854E940|nr:transglycosylase domain-containing protein [Aliifodinibius sp. S!AR15-10]MDR8390207.1 transglycosylase domain-containing protein [Aliifodinibius sp. S!AR15-10]
MGDSNNRDEMDRYFSDPEYRRKKIEERNQSGGSQSNPEQQDNTARQKLIHAAGIAMLLLLLGGGAFTFFLFQGLPSIEQLENPDTAIASLVKSRDGVVLDKFFYENRRWVTLDEISPNVVDALVAVEDHRFYDHWGIDMVRTLAIPYHLMMGRIQGGSTLTQQLARNLYKKIGREFSVIRKLREMITAIQLEQNYTKREIIEMYLNTVEYSNSAMGIEVAAETHYGKPAADLTISEAATLVGSVNAVYAYNPRLFPERSKQRQNVVLSQMQKRGFISEEVYNKLAEEPISLNYHPPSKSGRESRYFGEYVRQRIMEWTKENGYDLYRDGLTIHTTIDSRLQKHAEQALKQKLDSVQSKFVDEWTSPGGEYMDRYWKKYPGFLRDYIRETDRYKNAFSNYNTDQESVVFDTLLADSAFVDSVKRVNTRLQASFVSINPKNGRILTWVGGYDYGNVQYDHVYQSTRQAGSTFKPFVYAVAIDNGYRPYHKFSKYPSKFIDRAGRTWAPTDPSLPSGPEMVPLRQGLARSLNNVTVRLLPEISGHPNTNKLADLESGAEKIKSMAQNMGIDMSGVKPYPSIALGTAEVSLLDLVSAYTTFANQGVHINPIAITRIEDKEGNVLEEYHEEYPQEVISKETAYIMIDMMRGVIRGGEDYHGTGVRLRNVYEVNQDVAGKTGTTQDAADNWFVAMMPHIVMGAWVGGEDRKIRFPENTYIGQGARSALPIVGTFINSAKNDPEVNWSYDAFEAPPGFTQSLLYDPETSEEQPIKDGRKGRIGW